MDFCSIDDAWGEQNTFLNASNGSVKNNHSNNHSVSFSTIEGFNAIEQPIVAENTYVSGPLSSQMLSDVAEYSTAPRATINRVNSIPNDADIQTIRRVLSDPAMKQIVLNELGSSIHTLRNSTNISRTARDTLCDIWYRNIVDEVRYLGFSKELKEKLILLIISMCIILLIL